MKVSVILSEEQKLKLNSIFNYKNIMLSATLFEIYKQQANGNNLWLISRIGNEVMSVQADIFGTVPLTVIEFYQTRVFNPRYCSDVIPLLQDNLTRFIGQF